MLDHFVECLVVFCLLNNLLVLEVVGSVGHSQSYLVLILQIAQH